MSQLRYAGREIAGARGSGSLTIRKRETATERRAYIRRRLMWPSIPAPFGSGAMLLD